MYSLYNGEVDFQSSTIKQGNFNYVRKTYDREIKKVINYYSTKPFVVRSNHILARILTIGAIPIHYDIDRYMEVAYARSPYVAKAFNLTSSINYGKIFNGHFYGLGNSEILLYNESYFNPYEALENWRELRPVTVLDNSLSDLNPCLPNGVRNSTAYGICVISIDIPMLLLQFRGFLIEQYNKEKTNQNGMLGATHFIHMYVLPNMMYSHFDCILRNRIISRFYGEPYSERLVSTVFHFIDASSKLDKIIDEVIKTLKNKNAVFTDYLKIMPSIYEENMYESIVMPDIPRTRQVWWALYLSKLKMTKFLIDIGGSKGVVRNRDYIGKMKIDIRRLLEENAYSGILDKDLAYDVKETMLELLKT